MSGLTTRGQSRGLAVVAGAGSGIGAATAIRLALQHRTLLLVGRRTDRLAHTAATISALGNDVEVHTLSADLRTPAAVEQVAAESRRVGGDVDTLVTAVGGYHRPQGKGLAASAELWQADWALNVLTAVLLTEALRPLLTSGSGRIVAVSSIAAVDGTGGSYASAKSALHGWVRTTARELASSRITVNAVAPGYVERTEFFGRPLRQETHERLAAASPSGRASTPEEVAEAIAWLASGPAGHVTGQVLLLDGGQTLGQSRLPE